LSKTDMQDDACLSKIDTQTAECLSKIDRGVSIIDTPRLSKIDTTKDILLKNTIQKESKRARTCKTKTAIPEDFGISEAVLKWATEQGHTHLQQHLESFIDKAKSKQYQYADWDAAFREAIRKNWAGVGQPQYSKPAQEMAPSTRQVESPAPESSQRVSLFSGMEMIKFNELRALKPEVTQIQIRAMAQQHGMDVFVLMDRMVKKLKAGEAA
ncbi:MAG: hypothetical protein VXW65_01510, partial [Pseudomonadota bacterium]|nr:hypothetical protein [Pseudomonadota bacterium]